MKKAIYILVFLTVSLVTFSQKRALNNNFYVVSKPYTEFSSHINQYLANDNLAIAIKFQSKKIVIQKFDIAKPAFISEKEYEYGSTYFPKGFYLGDLHEINNRFYYFFSLWDKEKKKEQLFANEIDFVNGEFISQPQLVMQVDGKVKDPMFHKFETLISSDKKTIVVKYCKIPQVKDDKKNFDVMGFTSFDSNLKKIESKEIKMPYTERRLVNLDYQIDSKGNLYMLTKIFHDDSQDDKKSKSDLEANYHIEIFTIKAGSDKITTTKLDDKDKFINNLQLFEESKSSGIIAGGYYSNGKGKNFQDNCDGVIIFKIKDDGSIYDKNYYEVPVELINEYESASTVRKNERKEEKGEGAKLTHLKLKNQKILEDGSILLIGEQYYVIERIQTGRGQSSFPHYKDILVTKIMPDGKLGWMQKISKHQSENVRDDGTYKFLNSSKDLFLLYFDDIKNIDLEPGKEPVMYTGGGYLNSVKMNIVDGSYIKTSILNPREAHDFNLRYFSPQNTIDFSENSFVIEAPKNDKENVLIKFTLK